MEMLLRPEPTVAKDLICSLDETRVGILCSFPFLTFKHVFPRICLHQKKKRKLSLKNSACDGKHIFYAYLQNSDGSGVNVGQQW